MRQNNNNSWFHNVFETMGKLNPDVKDIYESKIVNKRTLQENIDFYRKRLHGARTTKEAVMDRFYGLPTNRCRPMLIERITLDRIIKKHGENGLITVSACRSDNTTEENDILTRSLIKDLQNSPYSYLPGYGGYRDPELGEYGEFESSFIVFNYSRDGKPLNWEELRNFGINLCRKYNQSSVLVKAPGEPPIWLNSDGNKVSKDESNNVIKNDPKQEYFTSLKSREELTDNEEKYLKQQYIRYCKQKGIAPDFESKDFETFRNEHKNEIPVSRRYTYDMSWGGTDECYVNPSPCDLNERRMRTSVGEILVDTQIVD